MITKITRHRGASLTSYGLVVGLISIVALAAVTAIGSDINELFGETGSTLADVVSDTAPTPVVSPTPGISGVNFSNLDDQPVATQVSTAIIQPSITGSVTMTVGGDGSPEIRGCSDAACSSVSHPYAASVTVTPGTYLQVRATSPSALQLTHTVSVDGGGVSTSFDISTGSGDCQGSSSCMFHTSQNYDGDLGGLSGADSICTNDPNNPGGPAYAILATNGYNHDRGITLKLPVRRATDNTVIATTADQFFCHNSNSSQCSAWDAGLRSFGSTDRVWSGVVYLYNTGNPWSGSPTSANCSSWTSTSGSGNMGRRQEDTSTGKPTVWSEGNGPRPCSESLAVVCVSNVQSGP